VIDGRVGWIDGNSGRRAEAEVPRLTLAVTVDGPVRMTGTVSYAGRTIELAGQAGPREPARTVTGAAAWPVALN